MGGGSWRKPSWWAAGVTTLVLLGVPAIADAAAPDTEITKGPTGLIASEKATFKFKATKSGATFECRLDEGKWKDCESPRKLKRLGQGAHAFAVRAQKKGAVDATPAEAGFTVDTVPPDTTITSGPQEVSDDYTPSFEFTSEEGAAFECRLGNAAFGSCSSPDSPEAPLTDDIYTFEVRAVDAAGNPDPTPASDMFTVETPLRADLATAQAIHAFYLPSPAVFDVPASCGGDVEVDCTNGVPDPPTDQLSINTTSLNFSEIAGQNRVDVTMRAAVETIAPIKVKFQGAECALTIDSAGDNTPPDWGTQYSTQFFVHSGTQQLRAQITNLTLTNVEDGDWSLTGTSFICSLGSSFMSSSQISSIVADQLSNMMQPICAKPGPGYFEPCLQE